MLSKTFLDFITHEKLFEKHDHLLLAISGGLDSVVLAYLLKWNNYTFSLAHMNFQLRGEDSIQDEELVRNLADELEVEVFITKVRINKNLGSTQIQARQMRYEWFQKLIKNNGFAKLLTAHHANDLLETALLNLTRGTGIKGLRSILPLQNGIARPLLFADKSELEQFAINNSIKWREDISNASDDYTRNKLRHHVIPQLKSINPNLLTGFQQTALRLRATEKAWEEKLNEISDEYFRINGAVTEIAKSILNEPHAIIYLSELLSDYGFGLSKLQSFDFERVGAQLLSSTYTLSVDRTHIILTKIQEEHNSLKLPIKVKFDQKTIQLPFGHLKLEFVKLESITFEHNQNIAFFDFDCMQDSLEVDFWKEGDKIQPLGMKGKKKVSDVLIDQKVPLPQKSQVLVLKSEGEIAWVVGYKFSDLYKIKENTNKILRIQYYENS
ncbi:tRNA lysidine(34) synthetase TilS [Marivirga sp.]|uniref:tRNA lysidine(34) synthetase TilS n=1 Tax=Marivirga sp. TaxID=2018662 RepID=UPI002D7E2719|nr:tRNA lysidine(34) synthetase TilS [Marivirga sp.]HET8861318.1 tRNA lysidine(34) synthetase TilS [Marivirga sp.]